MGQIFYLVEDVDVANQVQRHGDKIQTALSSTQVIDGFYVHRTASGEGTADFLAMLHECVEEQYMHQPVYVLRDEMVHRDHYDVMQAQLREEHPGTPFHATFHTFQSLNGKSNAAGALQDIWFKMLLCIRRLSSEKAQEMVQRWPSPHHLDRAMRAYEAEVGSKDPQTFLSEMIDSVALVPRRKIGQALSEQVYTLLRSTEYVL